VVILIIGLGIAAALNADSIAIVRALSVDKPLRESLVAAAQESVKAGLPPAVQTTNGGATNPPAQAAKPAGPCDGDGKNSPNCQFETNLNRIKQLGLPIGWTTETGSPRSVHITWRGW